MTDSVRYTRCPKCQTAFKVSDAMLAVAAGKVRCGACLAVFNAKDYLLKPKQSTAADALSSSHSTPEKSDNEKTDDTVTESASHNEQAESESIEETQSQWQLPEDGQPATATDAEENIGEDEEQLFASIDAAIAGNDVDAEPVESASAGLAEDSETRLDGEPAPQQWQLPESELEQIQNDEKEQWQLPQHESETTITPEEAPADEPEEEPEAPSMSVDAVYESLDEAEQDADTEWQEDPARQEPAIDDDIDDLLDEAYAAIDEESEATTPETSSTEQQDMADEDEILDPDKLAENLGLQLEDAGAEPDPLEEFDELVEEKSRWPRWVIALSLLLAVLILGSVQFWQNRQQLAWSETWGPTVKSLCGFLPCNLQPRRDISAIKLRQRQVIPSGEDAQKLDIKMLLTNDAAFAQPYPVIVIRFSNSMGQQVALRRVTPAQYLPAEAQDELIPAQSEVHIQFTTELPHPDALGFEFRFE